MDVALKLIKAGKLFALQDWLKDRKYEGCLPDEDWLRLLGGALESGFHSMVQLLLEARRCSPKTLTRLAERALWKRRADLAELLFTHGATIVDLDFETVCHAIDKRLMEEFLRAGGDPGRNNGFARVLDEHKAKPLLGFYRGMRSEFPVLDAQAALALCVAVQAKNARWVALLRWAGADPFRAVPWELSGDWNTSEFLTTAAEAACWDQSGEMLDALKIRPNVDQAIDLLNASAWSANVHFFRTILKFIPRERINDTERNSSTALQKVLTKEYCSRWDRVPQVDIEKQWSEAVELLLDYGARWDPDPEQMRDARLGLGRNSARYVVQIVRLLLYTPGACEPQQIWELCRTDKMRTLIRSADPPLWEELREIRVSAPLIS